MQRDQRCITSIHNTKRSRAMFNPDSTTSIKCCTKCNTELPASSEYFDRNRFRPDGLRLWCKSCCIAEDRQWENERTEKRRARKVKYYSKYYDENPEIYKVNNSKRRARKRNAEGTHNVADIEAQYQRQQGSCHYCGCALTKAPRFTNSATVDHVVPLSRGGSNSPDNLVIACMDCNRRKHNKLLCEWSGSDYFNF